MRVDSRIKVLSFHEDYRPPYKGTFSKFSSVLKGRNPFEKDHNMFNYDYDSEGEWEEGDGEGSHDHDYDKMGWTMCLFFLFSLMIS